jgi:ubiquinone/menaquinone biosynthesis C-methylase UbiE
MTIIHDPEGNETLVLRSMIDFSPAEVLEIGCGDGRLTWRYIDVVGHITAIDPNGKEIETAKAAMPAKYKNKVDFIETSLKEFYKTIRAPRFDLVIFSWAL